MNSGNLGVLRCAAICQRHVLESAHELQSQQEELQEMLLEFYEQHLQEHFPETSYTFDVYITTAGRVQSLNGLPNLEKEVVSDTRTCTARLSPHDLRSHHVRQALVCAQHLCHRQG